MTTTKYTTMRERNQQANTTPMLLFLSFRMRLPIWLLIGKVPHSYDVPAKRRMTLGYARMRACTHTHTHTHTHRWP